jgi:spermidine/putrescine transport system permease protein
MSLAVGYTVAYYIARLAKETWRGVLMALIVIPFWISFIVRIYGVKLFVQPGGYIDLGFQAVGLPGAGQYFVANFGLNTDPLLIFTLVYVWLPFMVLPLFTSLSRVDTQLLEAAYDLGATRLRAFWSVTLPLTLPGIVTGSIFVFITTLGSFVEPNFLQMQTLMIGNYVDTQYNQTQGVGVPLGAAASVFIIVSTMLLITIYARSAEAEESGVYAAKGKPRPMSLMGRYTLLLLAASVLSPLAVAGVVRTVWAPSVVAVADLALVAAVLLAVTAHALIEAEVRRHKPPDRAVTLRTNAVGGFLIVAGSWALVRGLAYAFESGAREPAPWSSILAVAVGVALVFVFLGHAGLVLFRGRGFRGEPSLRSIRRYLMSGGHALGLTAGASMRAVRKAVSGGRRAFAWTADRFGRRALPVLDRIAERQGRRMLATLTAVTLLIFFVPLLLMALFSFTAGENPSAWEGFSVRWYVGGGAQWRDALFTDPNVLGSLGVSVIVGVASAFLSLVLGMMAAFAINRYAFRGKAVLNHAMYLGLVIPSIVMGISLSILIRLLNDSIFAPLGARWEFGLLSLIVGHTTFNIPLATLVLLISFREFDRSLEEAAMNLGARPLTTFFRVTIPNIMPGIVSTLLLTFTFSFDEFPVSLFLAGSNSTYPIVAWGLLSKKIPTPESNAAATLILLISVVFVLLANKVQKGGTIFRI